MPAAPAAPPPAAPVTETPSAPIMPGGFIPPPRPPASERFAEQFAEFDKAAAESDNDGVPVKPAKAATPPPEKKAETPKPAEKPADKPAEKAAEKLAETTADPADKKPVVDDEEDPSAKFQEAKAVREWGKGLHKELKKVKQELEAAKTKKADDTESKTLKEEVEALRKRKADLETELKFVSYEKTDDYNQKYWEPMVEALSVAHNEIKELTVEDDAGTQRKATPEDFDPLLNMPLGQAAALAKQMFGDLAPEVMAHRRRYIELNQRRLKAIEDFRKHGAEREQQTSAQRAEAMKAAKEAFEAANKKAAEEMPQYFAPQEGDEEGNDALTKGYALADMAFKSDNNLSMIDRAKLHAEIRNRAAGFSRLALQNKRKDEKIAELEAKLAAFEKSEPAGGDTGRTETTGPMSVDDEIDAIAAGKRF